jgi:hypothetical protein
MVRIAGLLENGDFAVRVSAYATAATGNYHHSRATLQRDLREIEVLRCVRGVRYGARVRGTRSDVGIANQYIGEAGGELLCCGAAVRSDDSEPEQRDKPNSKCIIGEPHRDLFSTG